MTPEDKQFLDDHRHHHDTLMRAGFVQNLDYRVKEQMQTIISRYFQPGYTATLWCGDCVAEMIKICYRHYDKWLVEQDRKTLEERTVHMTFPKQDP